MHISPSLGIFIDYHGNNPQLYDLITLKLKLIWSTLCSVVEQPTPAPAPEVVREVTPEPVPENEATAQEVFDDEGSTGAEEEKHTGQVPVEDNTSPVIEEPESPMVQTTPVRDNPVPVQEPESVGEQPKKSYASIVSFCHFFRQESSVIPPVHASVK